MIALVVILGLPGLGKSFLLKQFDTMLKERHRILKGLRGGVAGKVLMLHKDQLTAEFKHANKGLAPKMKDLKTMILARVHAASSPDIITAVVFNMNMNLDWFKGTF